MPRSTATAFAMVCLVLLTSPAADSHLVPCRRGADAGRVADALRDIRRSVDPCGNSAEVTRILDRFERCAGRRYEICTSSTADRNLFDRRVITWNPDLRSPLESSCEGDAATPVVRDPTASLLHEIVHAVQECEGRNPGVYELEAVRVENIYRRAAGLCQRTRYGDDDPLPLDMMRVCSAGHCSCGIPDVIRAAGVALGPRHRVTDESGAADSAAKPADPAAEPVH